MSDDRRFHIGQRVVWWHRTPGGYGYAEQIPATVEWVNQQRVRIRFAARGRDITRWVHPRNLQATPGQSVGVE